MKTINQITKTLVCISILFLSITTSSAQNQPTLDELSKQLADLEQAQDLIWKLENNKNFIMIHDYYQIRLGLDKVVTLQQLADSLTQIALLEDGRLPDWDGDLMKMDIPKITNVILQLSNEMKSQLQHYVLPDIELRIRKIKREIKYELAQNGVNNPYSPAFDQTTEQNPNVRFNNNGSEPQCLETNPDMSSSHHTFDTNNNPNDQTYIKCNYFKDGWLRDQHPYSDGEIDGVELSYVIKEQAGRYLSRRDDWRAGKRNYTWVWATDRDGEVYKLSERSYSSGIQSTSTEWHPNGLIKNYTEYKPDGHSARAKNWNINGELTYCTEWDDNGHPHTSRENCNW